ncbi:MAG: ANTAR domain-containing protein [Clostridia bacterium]|nr:ANTAR domain-containing protein [Clostridia bacterium]
MRNIILAFPDESMSDKIRRIFLSAGIQVAGTAASRTQLLQTAARLDGGGVIVLPAWLSGSPSATLTSDLSEDYDLLVLLSGNEMWDNSRAGVFALRAPIRPIELLDSVRMLLETRQLAAGTRHAKIMPAVPEVTATDKREHRPPARSESERKIIDQAKQLLIVRNNMSEEQAHRFLQKRSMDSGNPLVAVARQILDT